MAADPAEDALVDGAVGVAEGDVLDPEVSRQFRVPLAPPFRLSQADARWVDMDRHLWCGKWGEEGGEVGH